MRAALLDNRSGNRKDRQAFVPAPTGGINSLRNPLRLRDNEAIDLVNWIAAPNELRTRGGSASFSVTAQAVTSLLSYVEGSTTRVFASGATAFYEVTTGTPSTAFACTSSDYAGFNFAAGGANYLYALNGVDPPQLYNGTSWQAVTAVSSPIAITGVDASDLMTGVPYNERIFFLKPGKKSFYYLGVGLVGGTLTEFPVGRYLARGGSLAAMGVVSFDGGDGLNSYLAVASTEGELLLYQGTDPSSPSTWALRGSYVIGKPLNKHAFLQYGSSLLYLCEGGLFDVVSSLAGARVGKATAVSEKIGPQLEALIRIYGPSVKWRLSYNPMERVLILNTPDATGYQFIQEARGGAWSRFLGWPASDFHFVSGVQYFASEGGVYKAFIGTADSGAPISAEAYCAPIAHGGPGLLTEVVGLRQWMKYEGAFTYGSAVLNDLDVAAISTYLNTSGTGGLTWNVSNWNEANWGGAAAELRVWETPPTEPSDRVAIALKVFGSGHRVQWLGTDVAYLTGRSW